jgi:hypothetical protein
VERSRERYHGWGIGVDGGPLERRSEGGMAFCKSQPMGGEVWNGREMVNRRARVVFQVSLGMDDRQV